MTMVTVGGVRYREETAKKLGLTPDSKAHAKKVAENTAPTGVSEAEFKAVTAAATTVRKAAGGADSTKAPSPTNTGTTDGGGDGTKPADPNGNGGKPADGK